MDQQPTSDVGTELLFENDALRVWDIQLSPGERSAYHAHHTDYVIVYVTPSTITLRETPDAEGVTRDYADGHVHYMNVPAEGVSHQIENARDEPHRHMVIELKTTNGIAASENNGRVTDRAS